MQCNETFILKFQGKPSDKESDFELNAEFTHESGETVSAKGFYAGNGCYQIRFLPQEPGHYQWKTTGLFTTNGETNCAPSKAGHGIVRANGIRFQHADGTPYRPMGTTVYALPSQPEERIKTTINTLKNSPFNKVRFCIFPKWYDYNHDEPSLFPFEFTKQGIPNIDKPCLEYWDRLDSIIRKLNSLSIQADIILFHPYDKSEWGYSTLNHDQCLTYLEYAVKRLAAYPNVWWSLANEYDLIPSFKPEWWHDFARVITEHDPYSHLLSNHHCAIEQDASWPEITHCSIQDKQPAKVKSLIERYGKPVIIDECGYEGDLPFNWGNLSAFEMVNRFWTAFVLGGYCSHGETFESDDEIIWWAKGGILHGDSPRRIAFLRKIMESVPNTIKPGPIPTSKKSSNKLVEQLVSRFDSTGRIQWAIDNMPCQGHCESEMLLVYYGHQYCRHAVIDLPEDHWYDIEVIDVWNMTRFTVLTHVKGEVAVPMPAERGIAIMARQSKS
ncbi:DUF4038 domain-containing protein [Bifidobacterium sp. SO4]|uniref:apiosidase-like domain-containing protein n=1 Tax=Bifidobacterium sp. SO4 TaxID=2809030 RepID=UPI001BDC5965|nr:DUF4038 domain-containing protein [Bifidobacterium sp. SO4]MBT1170621.1 DUF4038 domain-containing protein [Bifidobacterium sp. SO4]